jgi:hypothetical protein
VATQHPLDHVRAEWRARVVAEHRSGRITHAMVLALRDVDAPAALQAAARRIEQDERDHSALSRKVYARAGGDAADVNLRREVHGPYAPPYTNPLHRALELSASVYCCGETVAVPLFLTMLRGAIQPLAVSTLQRILKDEGRHRAFGWASLKALLRLGGADARAFLLPRVPMYVSGVVDAYTAPSRRLSAVERAWGMLPPQDYAGIVREAARKVIIPRFAAAGFPVKPV